MTDNDNNKILWTATRKEAVVRVLGCIPNMPVFEALGALGISWEEYCTWVERYDKDGLDGLKATKLQNYRPSEVTPGVSRRGPRKTKEAPLTKGK